ncbi:MAG TPA: hypothetical protein VH370_14820 [Humisphaera sp.]|jgi:hypothetical protein|nr:hypothetical protein [Humisphaera sp.]
MFYLGGSDFPETADGLAKAVAAGLAQMLELPARPPVNLAGAFPAIDRADVNLTGAVARIDKLPPPPKGVKSIKPAASARQLQIIGQPVRIETAAVELSLTAQAAQFDYGRDLTGRPMLLLADAKEGKLSVQIRNSDIQQLVLAAATKAAAAQGVQVQEAKLNLSQTAERSIGIEARVKAKKMFMSAVILVRGQLNIDPTLIARLSNLSCTGEGVMGSMACGLIQPHLNELQNRDLPLTALSLGDIRLRDLKLGVTDKVSVSAEFGS